jgi:hypothetical protein
MVRSANFKVATAMKWFKVPNHMTQQRKSTKNSKKLHNWAKNPPARCQNSPSVQLDPRSQAMSIVNIFTTATGGKQANFKFSNSVKRYNFLTLQNS